MKQDKRYISIIEVSIQFSKEIAYWGTEGYYQNSKFYEFWDKINRTEKYRDNLWRVMYMNPKSLDEAQNHHCIRTLRIYNSSKCIEISPNMHTFLITQPTNCESSPIVSLNDLYSICKDCAEYCGGTVNFTYSERSRIFEWPQVRQRTVTGGKVSKRSRGKMMFRPTTPQKPIKSWKGKNY